MSALFFIIFFSIIINTTFALFSYTYSYISSDSYKTSYDYDSYFDGVVEYEFSLLDFGGDVVFDFNNADFTNLIKSDFIATLRIGKEGLLENGKRDFVSFELTQGRYINYKDGAFVNFLFPHTIFCQEIEPECIKNFITVSGGKNIQIDLPTPLEWVNLLHSENAESSFSAAGVKAGAWTDFYNDLQDGNLSDYTINVEVNQFIESANYYFPFIYGSTDNAATLHKTLSLITQSGSQLSTLQTFYAFFKGLGQQYLGNTDTQLDTSVCDSTTTYGVGSEYFPDGVVYCYIFLRDASNNKINISSKNLDFTFKIELKDGVSSEIFQRFKDNLQLQANVYFTFNSSDFSSAGLPPLILNHENFTFDDENQSISTEFIITSAAAQQFIENETSTDYLLYKSFYIEFADSVRNYIFTSRILPYKIVYSDTTDLSGFSQSTLDLDYQTIDLSFGSDLVQNEDLTYTPSESLFIKMFFIIIDEIPIFGFLSGLKDKLDEIDSKVYTSGSTGCIIDIPTAGLTDNVSDLLQDSGFKDNIRICREAWSSGPVAPLIDAIVDVIKVITGFFFGVFLIFRFVSIWSPNRSESPV